MNRSLAIGAVAAGLALATVTPAQAGHESNNAFDLRPTAAGPAGSDGGGVSNYLKGWSETTGEEVWNTHVSVSGLAPGSYGFYAENGPGTVRTLVCTLTVGAEGDASCRNDKHEEPAFARARVRNTADAVVLEAAGSTDEDNQLDDGEIERRGDCRAPDQAGGTCTRP